MCEGRKGERKEGRKEGRGEWISEWITGSMHGLIKMYEWINQVYMLVSW